MRCLICEKTIEAGEQVFCGSQVMYTGAEDGDCDYCMDSNNLTGVIHIVCILNPAETTRTPNMAIAEHVEEELVVKRSDALSLLIGGK